MTLAVGDSRSSSSLAVVVLSSCWDYTFLIAFIASLRTPNN